MDADQHQSERGDSKQQMKRHAECNPSDTLLNFFAPNDAWKEQERYAQVQVMSAFRVHAARQRFFHPFVEAKHMLKDLVGCNEQLGSCDRQ